MFIFPVQLTTSRIGNLARLIHTLLYVMTIHHVDNNPLHRSIGIEIVTKPVPGPANREHGKRMSFKTMSLGTNYSFNCCTASILESELQATEKTV